MKNLRRICAGLLLIFALSVPALAGEMDFPGITDGPQESPGVTGPQESPGITGEMSTPGFAGDIWTPGISLLSSLLP